jgi:hypothetical protein
MSKVVPFPLSKRRSFIARQAKRAAALNAAACERHIALQIEIQRDTLLRRGVEENILRRELKGMEASIRAALWEIIFRSGGAA